MCVRECVCLYVFAYEGLLSVFVALLWNDLFVCFVLSLCACVQFVGFCIVCVCEGCVFDSLCPCGNTTVSVHAHLSIRSSLFGLVSFMCMLCVCVYSACVEFASGTTASSSLS